MFFFFFFFFFFVCLLWFSCLFARTSDFQDSLGKKSNACVFVLFFVLFFLFVCCGFRVCLPVQVTFRTPWGKKAMHVFGQPTYEILTEYE